MPSKDPLQRFEDIVQNITLIEGLTAGMDLTTFTQDAKTTNATERCRGTNTTQLTLFVCG